MKDFERFGLFCFVGLVTNAAWINCSD
jgi:hypothetical protein